MTRFVSVILAFVETKCFVSLRFPEMHFCKEIVVCCLTAGNRDDETTSKAPWVLFCAIVFNSLVDPMFLGDFVCCLLLFLEWTMVNRHKTVWK